MSTAVPSDEHRQDALDGWRGVASLMIYWTHTGTAVVLAPFVIWLWTGVHFFFVLSGFLIFRPFLLATLAGKPGPAFLPYCGRRFLRIYPPYLVALVVAIIARYATGRHPPDGWTILAHATLIYNYCYGDNLFRINAVFWTLMIEAQFYLLLPFIVQACRIVCRNAPQRSTGLILVVFLLGGPLARAIEFMNFGNPIGASGIRFTSIFSFLDMFGYGMAVAYLQVMGARVFKGSSSLRWLVLASGFFLFLLANYFAYVQMEQGNEWMNSPDLLFILGFPALVSFSIGLLLLAVTTVPAKAFILNWKPLVGVGIVSYSLYLYHIPVQILLFSYVDLTSTIADFHVRGFVYGLIFLIPTLAVSAVAYYLVENPSIRLAHLIRTSRSRNRPEPVLCGR